MPFSALVTWEVRTAGNDTNGGGFKTGASGTDYSLQDTKNSGGNDSSTTDAVAVGNNVLTSVTASFTSAIVGNAIYLQGGTGSLAAGWYEVTTFTNSTTIDLDRPVAAGTGITMNIGGALKSPAQAAAAKVAGNDVYIKNDGTYSVTTASTNVANGCVLDNTGGVDTTRFSRWIGYTSNRTWDNTDTRPLIQASGAISSFNLFEMAQVAIHVFNLRLDCASKSTTKGLVFSHNYQTAWNCQVLNATSYGIDGFTGGGNSSVIYDCEATGCSGTAAIAGSASVTPILCEAHANTCPGFYVPPNGTAVFCLSYGNTGGSSHGFDGSSVGTRCIACTSYGNGGAGFNATSNLALGSQFINCMAQGNSDEGWKTDGVAAGVILINCAGYNNTTDNYNASNVALVMGFVVGSASFFTNAAGGDFSLNNTAGGGAAARAVGIPGAYPTGTTIGYQDIGGVQHQATGTGDTFISMCYPLIVHGSANTAY